MLTSHEHIDIPGLPKKSNLLQVNDAKKRKIKKGREGGMEGRLKGRRKRWNTGRREGREGGRKKGRKIRR